jgi:hypothetical protein
MTARIDHVNEELTTRIDRVDEKLTARIDHVNEELTIRIDRVDEKLTARLDRVDGDVSLLNVLHEDLRDTVRKVAEVQVHHGERLEEHGRMLVELRDMVLPLRDLAEWVPILARKYDERITALEKHTGLT